MLSTFLPTSQRFPFAHRGSTDLCPMIPELRETSQLSVRYLFQRVHITLGNPVKLGHLVGSYVATTNGFQLG